MNDKTMVGKKWIKIWVEVEGELVEKRILGWTIAAAAREAGCTTGAIDYRIRHGDVPKPKLSCGGRRYFTLDEVDQIKEQVANEARQRQDLWNKTAAARHFCVDLVVIDFHIKHGHFPEPSIKTRACHYWTPEEFQKVRDYFSTRKYAKSRLMQLHPGLLELGARPIELDWLKRNRPKYPELQIEPELDMGTRKTRYYTRAQLEKLIRLVRIFRAEKNLS